ncbi:allergen Asp f 7 homolog isoform X2 [Ananas comosus]|uniref:Allergen Asp f 7 homolog isoform X2 n=1 Tax=Ananas comosus TaxID=4615 RepID=A0A6P5GPV8_ANACO|nr:allergen Asp f 7 homolog isoform X2 [Ananas comosus]
MDLEVSGLFDDDAAAAFVGSASSCPGAPTPPSSSTTMTCATSSTASPRAPPSQPQQPTAAPRPRSTWSGIRISPLPTTTMAAPMAVAVMVMDHKLIQGYVA